MIERAGSPDLKRGANFEDGTAVADWVNLPPAATIESLDASLHDAHVVSITSNALERSATLWCDVWHLRQFYEFPDSFQVVLNLSGVQSARVFRYAVWPGQFVLPTGASRDEESRLVREYQAKWREESFSWPEFEKAIARENQQVLDIADAALATFNGSVALRLRGHLNFTTYHEIFLRAEKLSISATDGKHFDVKEFLQLGERYWEAFSRRP